MIPGRITNATRVLGAPKDWDPAVNGPCGGLPVVDYVDEQGVPWMASAWTPLPEELAALVAGGSLLLGIQGSNHPVVWVAAGKPPE